MTTPEEERAYQSAAFELVGEFLWHWSYLESLITEGIQSALRMPHPQGEIVLANVSFRDKISMASTLSHHLLTLSLKESRAEEAARLFNQIVQFNGNYRNQLVHNPFDALEGGGIEIFRVRAKGKFDFPETKWNRDFFRARFEEIDTFVAQLQELFEELKNSPTASDLIGAAWKATKPPSEGNGEPNP
jgi:hypothetical protein